MPTLHQKCLVCNNDIYSDDVTNEHHSHYRSNGGEGTPTETLHRDCHIAIHTEDFKAWGRIGGQISALSKQWAFNLLNVRTDPVHEINREFFKLYYSH